MEIPFGLRTKRALQHAAQEADDLHHAHIRGEHLLLGLLRKETSAAATVLAAHGVRLADVRAAVAKLDVARGFSSPEAAAQHIAQIKGMVAQLARSAPDSPEAAALVDGISGALNGLLGEGGIPIN